MTSTNFKKITLFNAMQIFLQNLHLNSCIMFQKMHFILKTETMTLRELLKNEIRMISQQ